MRYQPSPLPPPHFPSRVCPRLRPQEPPIITPRELDERPRSARTAAGVRFAAAEQIFEQHGGGDNFDALRPRTAVSRGGGAERKEAKKFEFTADGHMNDWHTAVQHEIEDTTNVKDAFPTPAFVRKSIDERARSAESKVQQKPYPYQAD